jgi:hypothetical protein
MLALEDGKALRVCAGITASDLRDENAWRLKDSPTRFGRINLDVEQVGEHAWRVRFKRGPGPAPMSVTLPSEMGGVKFQSARGAGSKAAEGDVELDPATRSWEAFFS